VTPSNCSQNYQEAEDTESTHMTMFVSYHTSPKPGYKRTKESCKIQLTLRLLLATIDKKYMDMRTYL